MHRMRCRRPTLSIANLSPPGCRNQKAAPKLAVQKGIDFDWVKVPEAAARDLLQAVPEAGCKIGRSICDTVDPTHPERHPNPTRWQAHPDTPYSIVCRARPRLRCQNIHGTTTGYNYHRKELSRSRRYA